MRFAYWLARPEHVADMAAIFVEVILVVVFAVKELAGFYDLGCGFLFKNA